MEEFWRGGASSWQTGRRLAGWLAGGSERLTIQGKLVPITLGATLARSLAHNVALAGCSRARALFSLSLRHLFRQPASEPSKLAATRTLFLFVRFQCCCRSCRRCQQFSFAVSLSRSLRLSPSPSGVSPPPVCCAAATPLALCELNNRNPFRENLRGCARSALLGRHASLGLRSRARAQSAAGGPVRSDSTHQARRAATSCPKCARARDAKLGDALAAAAAAAPMAAAAAVAVAGAARDSPCSLHFLRISHKRRLRINNFTIKLTDASCINNSNHT